MKIDISQDISDIEAKILFGFTLRQLIGFGLSALLGAPLYFFSKLTLRSNDSALLIASCVVAPILCCTFMKKNDLPLEEHYKQQFLHLFYRKKERFRKKSILLTKKKGGDRSEK